MTIAARRQRAPLGPALARTGLPRLPTPSPAMQMHAHEYIDNSIFAGKRVVVLGMGNSAMDIAVESSYVAREHLPGGPQRRLDRAEVHLRQTGRPAPQRPAGPVRDPAADHPEPDQVQRGTRPSSYGLPKPDHRFGEAHPTISGRILDRIQHGAITPKPNIASLDGDNVRFVDGTAVEADVVVYCTGYKITFPFFDERPDPRAGKPHRAVPAGLPPGHPERLLHRPAAATRAP